MDRSVGGPPLSSSEPTPISHTIRVPPTRMAVAGLTDAGLVRDSNEDAFLVRNLRPQETSEAATDASMVSEVRADMVPAALIAVSDGMGGQLAGEVASATALLTLDRWVREATDDETYWDANRTKEWLQKAVQEANTSVLEKSREDASTRGMGATLSAIMVLGDRISVAHVGDSRVYLCRNGRLRQLTMDHTHVQSLVEKGHLSVEQARAHHERNLLVQAIGVAESVGVDVTELAADQGDSLLLCSDGVHDFVNDAKIAEVLTSRTPPIEQCDTLIAAAKENHGSDNITAVVVQFR